MPQVIRSTQTKIVTKNGECELSINIEPIVVEVTVNVVGSTVDVKAQAAPAVEEEKEERVLVSQEFGKNNPFGVGKINFGKNG